MGQTRAICLSVILIASVEDAATACPTIPEETMIRWSDAVIDGVAVCDEKKSSCDLRPTEIVKDDVSFGEGPAIYRLPFERGAAEREIRDLGVLICVYPWEPDASRIAGRFYLNWRDGHWRVRQVNQSRAH